MDSIISSFNLFLSEVDAEYGDVLYHTEVQWGESWDRVETFFSFEARNINVHE
jgi:hypothetical protein